LLERLALIVRGGPASQAQLSQAAAEVDATAWPSPSFAGIMFALTRLVAGKTEAIAFVELGPDAVSVQTLIVGPDGVPVQLKLHSGSLPWHEILPLLPAGPDLRRLRMAGGIGVEAGGVADDSEPGDASPAALAGLVAEALGPVLDSFMAIASAAASVAHAEGGPGQGNGVPPQPPYRLDVVLVRRPLRWPVLEAAQAAARMRLRPLADLIVPVRAGDLATVVAQVARYTPLRHGCEVVLAEVGDDGAVAVRPQRLFAAGAAALPGERRPSVAIPVLPVPRHAARQLALPIVARREPVADYRDVTALKQARPLIGMFAMSGTVTAPVTLTVTLGGPGRLDVQPAPGLLPGRVIRDDWPGLIAGVPRQLRPPGGPAKEGHDLVLLVELGGSREQVAARVQLATELVSAIPADITWADTKVGVLGYRDHFGRHRVDVIDNPDRADEALVVGCAVSAPAVARSVFRRPALWRAVQVGDNHAAPVEEALAVIAGPGWRWRQGARHVLVVIGGRPPHPPREGSRGEPMLPCPHRTSWEGALRRLRQAQAIECFAVRDRPDTSDYSAYAWRQLGASSAGLAWRIGEVSAAEVISAIGNAGQPAAVQVGLASHARATQANRT
jgi:hypothetical protein